MATVDLFSTYPSVTHAVAFVELFICARLPGDMVPPIWEWITETRPALNPVEVVTLLRGWIESETDDWSIVVRDEMLRAEFTSYIAGRLGAM